MVEEASVQRFDICAPVSREMFERSLRRRDIRTCTYWQNTRFLNEDHGWKA